METLKKILGWLNRSRSSPMIFRRDSKLTENRGPTLSSGPTLSRSILETISIDGYDIIEKIGQGASSCVYLAKPHLLPAVPTAAHSAADMVAIKVSQVTVDQALIQARFRREAEVAGQLSSPYAIRILASGTTLSRQPFNVMEYVNGSDLACISQLHGQLPDGRVLAILIQLCDVLGELHRLGMIHRDIKPSNIMLVRTNNSAEAFGESIKLLDFGLASCVKSESEKTDVRFASGTPHYSAPETWQSPSSLDYRSDIYSLGCCAYHLLSGRTPFSGNNPLEICSKHLRDVPIHLSQLNLPIAQPLAEIIMRCLSRAPAARPQSTSEIAAALLQITPCQKASRTKCARN
jgi:eukaryotic-like serine/threonine-protein kinase